MSEDIETIVELVKRREVLVKRLDKRGISDEIQEQLFTDIEGINWKIAISHAGDIGEIYAKAKLLADVSGAAYPYTIEGALLKSIIDDLGKLSN